MTEQEALELIQKLYQRYDAGEITLDSYNDEIGKILHTAEGKK